MLMCAAEALRRAGIVERIDADNVIPKLREPRTAYELAGLGRPALCSFGA